MEAPDRQDEALREFLASRHVPCPRCGYDLFGTRNLVCAECGWVIDGDGLRYREVAPRSLFLVATTLGLAVWMVAGPMLVLYFLVPSKGPVPVRVAPLGILLAVAGVFGGFVGLAVSLIRRPMRWVLAPVELRWFIWAVIGAPGLALGPAALLLFLFAAVFVVRIWV